MSNNTPYDLVAARFTPTVALILGCGLGALVACSKGRGHFSSSLAWALLPMPQAARGRQISRSAAVSKAPETRRASAQPARDPKRALGISSSFCDIGQTLA